MQGNDTTGAPAASFATTRWTQVLAARGSTPEARAALGELCAIYWMPVFRFLAREGRDEDSARELTQEFFVRILAGSGFAQADPQRGRFRSFLLGAVRHFLGDLRARDGAVKRGGGTTFIPLAGENAFETQTGLQISDPEAQVPDAYFDREWALALMDRAFSLLTAELAAAGKLDQFQVLKPWLAGDAESLSQNEAARVLNLSEGAVKVAIHRLRKRFRELVRNEIAQTIPEPSDTDAELRYLVEVLAAR